MRNARTIRVTPPNRHSGKVSIQKSDIIDFLEGRIVTLVVSDAEFDHEVDDNNSTIYSGQRLSNLIASALKNGERITESDAVYFLANR